MGKTYNLDARIKLFEHKYKVRYNRAKAKQLEREISISENPRDIEDEWMDQEYDVFTDRQLARLSN